MDKEKHVTRNAKIARENGLAKTWQATENFSV